MKVTRIFAIPNGDARFEDVEIALEEAGAIGRCSPRLPVRNVMFNELAAGEPDFAAAEERHYLVLLSGSIEVETSSGDKRQFSGGEVVFVDDASGKGHRIRTVGDDVPLALVIAIGEAEETPATINRVDEASRESFPASDAPGWTNTAST